MMEWCYYEKYTTVIMPDDTTWTVVYAHYSPERVTLHYKGGLQLILQNSVWLRQCPQQAEPEKRPPESSLSREKLGFYLVVPLLLSLLLFCWYLDISRTPIAQEDEGNIFLSDINKDLLISTISHQLGEEYLAIWNKKVGAWPLKGKLIGDSSRPFVTIPVGVESSGPYLTVHFLVDTGSPVTVVAYQVVEALNSRGISFYINGQLHDTLDSFKNEFVDILEVNILGQDFLAASSGLLDLDYGGKHVMISLA